MSSSSVGRRVRQGGAFLLFAAALTVVMFITRFAIVDESTVASAFNALGLGIITAALAVTLNWWLARRREGNE